MSKQSATRRIGSIGWDEFFEILERTGRRARFPEGGATRTVQQWVDDIEAEDERLREENSYPPSRHSKVPPEFYE